MNTIIVILAAGTGSRLKSKLPKQIHMLAGHPLVEWSVRAAEVASTLLPVVVVGQGREQIQGLLDDRVDFAVQEEQLGTGHAAQQAEPFARGRADCVIVIYADMPLLRGESLQRLYALFQAHKAQEDIAIAMFTIERDDPQGFGRIVRDKTGQIAAVVEEADCTPEQRLIRELNPGIYCFDAEWLWDNLSLVPLSVKGEYYLTDMVGIAVAQARKVVSTSVDLAEVTGINTRIHMAEAATILRKRILDRHMLAGVTIVDPNNTYIEDTVEIGADTTILPGCYLQGNTTIGSDSLIGPHSQIVNSRIGNYSRITYSVIEEAVMGNHCEIGPFGHLRRGAELSDNVHMGNFGEVKNSYLGTGTKMGHFSYVGDTNVGQNVNIGAGTITCNYDGQKKSQTSIGDDVFVGSDSLLIAPLTVGEGARTGAGSVVTHDVPANTLVYGVPARQPRTTTTESDSKE